MWEGQEAGYTYAQPDALLAATAIVHELAVVTRNTADFERAGVRLYKPWTDAGAIALSGQPNTRRPAFQVPSTTPSSARPSNGVFCALPGSLPASTCQIRSG